LDFAINPFGNGVGQPMGDKVENKRTVFLEHLGNLDHRL
jgi:hypothetical protein